FAHFVASDGDDAARMCELDRVGQQVQQHLPELLGIRDGGDALVAARERQRQAVSRRQRTDEGLHGFQDLTYSYALQLVLDAARLDFREVQYGVDEPQ